MSNNENTYLKKKRKQKASSCKSTKDNTTIVVPSKVSNYYSIVYIVRAVYIKIISADS